MRDFHNDDDVSLDFETILNIVTVFEVDTLASAANSKGKSFFSRLDVPVQVSTSSVRPI